jgi:hypothetical protein
MDVRHVSPTVPPHRRGSTPMSQTFDRCDRVSLESVTLAHWGWSFMFLNVFENTIKQVDELRQAGATLFLFIVLLQRP